MPETSEELEPGDDGYIAPQRVRDHFTQHQKDIEILKPGEAPQEVDPEDAI